MAFRVYQFDGLQEVEHFLNGGISGGRIPVEGVRKLVGKTITFTSPADSCTFTTGTGPDPDTLQFKDIKTQMEAQISGLKVVLFAQQTIGFILATPTAAAALGATAEDARAILGLPRAGVVSGKLVLPSTDTGTPRLDGVGGGQDSQYLLYVWE